MEDLCELKLTVSPLSLSIYIYNILMLYKYFFLNISYLTHKIYELFQYDLYVQHEHCTDIKN
jgi:hypothetical protein